MRRRLMLVAATWTAVMGLVAGSAQAQATTPPGGQFVLVGVVLVAEERGLAWVQEPNFTNNKVVTVRLGDSVGPYRVTKILTHQVELTGPGGTVSVPLAGLPGAVSVASSVGTAQQPAGELPPAGELAPTPALRNSQVGSLGRGDPRRRFPAFQPRAASERGELDPAAVRASAPELAPTPGLQNHQVSRLERREPHRYFQFPVDKGYFPVDKMFLSPGQGPQIK